MHKKNVQQYAILALALLIIISFPKRTQNVIRNQFFKPLIPLAHLVPNSPKAGRLPQKISAPQKPTYKPTYPHSTLSKIIYRNPTHWNNFFWISCQKNDPNITLNSPVLYQNSLIGIVDFVGEKQARVKLITNSALTVSVRALRGKNQYYDLLNHINALVSYNTIQSHPLLSKELSKLKNQIIQSKESLYLAKGELFGLSQPLWRGDGKILLGRGFNCSVEDSLSIARELSSDQPTNKAKEQPSLILPDDLLITTGFDGIFPEGLAVAKVLTVDPLEEGAYYYSLKAAPIITELDSLSYVEVIAPINFEKKIKVTPLKL